MRPRSPHNPETPAPDSAATGSRLPGARDGSAEVTRIYPFTCFYAHYLNEHRDPVCRLLHYLGSWLVIAAVLATLITRRPALLLAAPLAGYGCAWIGHYFFEGNTPATFRQPWFSLAADWRLWWQITRGRASLLNIRTS